MTNFDKISTNAQDFSNSLMGLMEYVEGSMEKVIRKALLDLYKMIVERTPVDTGRAKASWGISTRHKDDFVPAKPEGYTYNEIEQAINSEMSNFKIDISDDQVVIYNNLEYIKNLENESSKQAPSGMVAISLAELTVHFNNALQQFGGDALQ